MARPMDPVRGGVLHRWQVGWIPEQAKPLDSL